MKFILSSMVMLSALILSCDSFAGTDHSISRDLAVSPPPAAKSDWEFAVGIPGWMAGLNGDIGVAGLNPVHVDLPFTKLVPHLDMVAALAVEAQHDRWGFFIAGVYEKLGVNGDTPGPLLDSVKVDVKMALAEVGVAYRLWEGKRGYFDVLAGARYFYMGSTMNFDLDSNGVQQVSQQLADDAVNRVTSAVEREVSELVPELKSAARSKITTGANSRIQAQVDRILAQYPRLPGVIDAISGRTGPVSDAVRELIAAKIAEKQITLTGVKAAVSAEVAAAKARAKSKLQSDVRRAEQNLANKIASTIKKAVPSQASGSKSWVDPFVGFRARYNFTDKLYAMTRADIGGFGVGSKLAWQAYGALGWQFNRHWSTELGYRYLSEDYESGGFVFDAALAGAYLGITYKF
ncbi:MAG: DUF2490 domain-containing protein [Verrucomicrobia bacterium]|nr:DUF2490 domain-containing protein [Verrucomicrobiota bacterium]